MGEINCHYCLCTCYGELWLHLVSSVEEPPSSKRVRTMEDEGMERLQTTALNLVEATITVKAGQERTCVMAYMHMYSNPNHTYMCSSTYALLVQPLTIEPQL